MKLVVIGASQFPGPQGIYEPLFVFINNFYQEVE